MPELPEVETMVRGLRPALVGKRLRAIEILDPFLLQGVTAEELAGRSAGALVLDVSRRGKWVMISLDRDAGLIVIQPRMTGGFWLVPPERPDHVRLSLHVAKPRKTVWFCDTRRLGKIAWYPDLAAASAASSRSQGPEALEIGLEALAAALARTSRPIKPTLMDQKVLAGIGNIYADEILFRSGIHPSTPARSLSPSRIGRIHAAISQVLLAAIEAEGSSFDAGYRTVLGLEGGFLAVNAMYGHGGRPCPVCATPVVKTRIEGLIGRPTHFCPRCQPEDPPGPAAAQ
ncbi:MAG: DNA-formamidopyrimidine glycosylase [Isosphaeraceae bacterium]|nr:DNA-formamidopyrimidine glycosylase [Isosphaeraceae bacterium]